ncbi:MAG: GNAT family N-acetyltransferase [Hymenobacter sp.]
MLAIATLANDYEVAKNTLNIPHPYHEEDARQWVWQARENFRRQVAYAFALELRTTGELVGGIGLNLEPRFDRAEAGYWLGRPHWGRGLATEALGALLRFGFEELG